MFQAVRTLCKGPEWKKTRTYFRRSEMSCLDRVERSKRIIEGNKAAEG